MNFTLSALALLFAFNACAAAPTASHYESVPAPDPEQATVELHAHLFMKEGMTWAFNGDFDGPLEAHDWTSRFSSQANPETLDRSGLAIVVVALYAHPLFTISLRNSIRRQIALTEKFVAEHPNWVIARDAGEARAAFAQGKRALVFSLEGADGIIDTEEDLKEFVDEKGIRIVTLLHLTDDQYGGVAFLRGFRALSSPWAWLSQAFHPAHSSEGGRINRNGLSQRGAAMARALIEHRVWIDLSHASDHSQEALTAMLTAEKLPLLYTHTSLRKYHGAERGILESQLQAVRKSGGVVGLMPSEEMLAGTPHSEPACEGGIQALATQYREAVTYTGADAVMLGSDYNGGIPHLHPSSSDCLASAGGPAGGGTIAIATTGLWNIGQVPEIWSGLERMHMPVPKPRRRMVEHFLEAWARVRVPSSSLPTPR